jgi:hypothetical protein
MQINTQTAGSRRKDKELFVRVLFLEGLDSFVSVSAGSLTIDPAVPVASHSQEIVENIE